MVISVDSDHEDANGRSGSQQSKRDEEAPADLSQTKDGDPAMADVKRYDLMQEGDYSQREGVMNEVGNGDWVRAEDYDELLAERDLLRTIVKDALEILNAA